MHDKTIWGWKADSYYFGSRGIAPFRRHSFEYDEFQTFYQRYLLAKNIESKSVQDFDSPLKLFIDFQKKKQDASKIKIQKERQQLPIKAFEDKIVQSIRDNRVVLIAADTGAGKSTQVPQYLMAAGFDKIACTQPRRIACYSLAKRVSFESLNQYGSEIAHQVRFDSSKTSKTRGVLLRQYAQDPYLSMYSVLIIDEVHERHITGDFLLGLVKKLLKVRLDIRVVLMSATINAELFAKYFDAPVIDIPGRMFPVTVEYHPAEDEDTNLTDPTFIKERDLAQVRESIASRGKLIKAAPYLRIIERIDEMIPQNERGDLLIFVSGMNEIDILSQDLKHYASISRLIVLTRRWIILELHSALSVAEQDRVFDIAPTGIRKCILSTNIAETSVTIDGIRFIIDSGKAKEIGHDTSNGISRLSEYWISQSSAKQRTGRAGRTGKGQCFRLYSKKEYDALHQFPVPEILRMPLDSIVLEIKTLGLGDPLAFDFIEQPSKVSITGSLKKLFDLGCIDNKQEVTDLGRVLASMPIDIVLGKILILGLISDLAGPIVAITAILSVQSPFTRVSDKESQILEKRQEFHSIHGDPFTLLNLFTQWLEEKNREGRTKNWCCSHGIEEQRMYEMVKLKGQFESVLKPYTVTCPVDLPTLDKEFVSKSKSNQKRALNKLKMVSRNVKRKYLNFETGEAELDVDGRETAETVDDLEFNLTHKPQDLLEQSDVTMLPRRELELIKLIVCSGLYPNIAVCDEANYARPPLDQVFHTKTKRLKFLIRFLNLVPSSVFSYNPELLQGENSDQQDVPKLLCYVQLLETTKPYLLNVTKVDALPVGLLFAQKVDISPDLLHLIIDEWLEIELPSESVANKVLTLGNWLRYAWQIVIATKLKKHENPRFKRTDHHHSKDKERHERLKSFDFVPRVITSMQADYFDMIEGKNSISDVDVLEKLLLLVELDVDYNCRKLRKSQIDEMFGYDPYSDISIHENLIEVTPNFNFYTVTRNSTPRERESYKLSSSTMQHSRPSQTDENIVKSKSYQRENYQCYVCERILLLTATEVIRHQRLCQKSV